MISFGIDPGSHRTGWGVIKAEGSSFSCVDAGVLTADSKAPLSERLTQIFNGLTAALSQHEPDQVFLESVFHHKSAKSALVLGQARGVALLAAGLKSHSVREVAPAEVKKAVTGRGRADKLQVQEMVKILLGLPAPLPSDASDALAIAIAGATRTRWTALTAEAST